MRYSNPLPWHLRKDPKREALRDCLRVIFLSSCYRHPNKHEFSRAERRLAKWAQSREFITEDFRITMLGKDWLQAGTPYAKHLVRELRGHSYLPESLRRTSSLNDLCEQYWKPIYTQRVKEFDSHIIDSLRYAFRIGQPQVGKTASVEASPPWAPNPWEGNDLTRDTETDWMEQL